MGAGSTGHIVSNRNNRNLQKSGRKSFFKIRKLTNSAARGNSTIRNLNPERLLKAISQRSRKAYFQVGIILIVFAGIWWFVYMM